MSPFKCIDFQKKGGTVPPPWNPSLGYCSHRSLVCNCLLTVFVYCNLFYFSQIFLYLHLDLFNQPCDYIFCDFLSIVDVFLQREYLIYICPLIYAIFLLAKIWNINCP